MKKKERITSEKYVEIDYHQFAQTPVLRAGMRLAGIFTWPIVLPLVALSYLSDFVFVTCSQLLSLIPYLVGTIIRYEFYRFTLKKCGKNVMIGFGTVFLYRDIEIGNNVLFGMYNTVHYCDFGSYVLVADGCRFLSGARYHNYNDTKRPMALQGGKLRRIKIGDDCWIGANAIIMDDLGTGSIAGAGAVVTRSVEPYSIVAGNPAKKIHSRL